MSKLIVFGRELIFLQAEIVISRVKKTTSGTELIFSRSTHIASPPNLIFFEAITLSEVLWAEIIWDASKATFSASVVILIGIVMGDFSLRGAILALPLCFTGATPFAALGLLVAATSRTIEEISYPQYLLVFPMFLFCGVFFPLTMLPLYLRWLAWSLPLTSIVSLMRTLTLGTPLQPQVFIVIVVWLTVLLPWSGQAMSRRLIK